jgi:16S rRNA (cytosine1402-N4)-methyltransferase
VSTSLHVPVLADEVLQWLAPRAGGTLVDGTLGGGGHARLLAERVLPDGIFIGVDRDPIAVERAAYVVAGPHVHLVCGNYADLPQILQSLGVPAVDGVVLDLGMSSDQLADDQRGFSFHGTGPLDLRFNPAEGEPAWCLLERLSETALADLIYHYGEERFSRRIARRIVAERDSLPIRTAAQLADLVRRCVPRSRHHALDPATRTFQALRIAVNHELEALERALAVMPDCLRSGGRLAIISFHSLEDRLVKQAFRGDPRLLALTKKPIRPIESEVSRNPRSRSARLRVAERRATA